MGNAERLQGRTVRSDKPEVPGRSDAVILALLLLTAVGSGVFTVIIAISIGSIAGTTRIIRSVVLMVKEMDFITAAQDGRFASANYSGAPQTVAPLLVIASASLGGAIFAESALSFLIGHTTAKRQLGRNAGWNACRAVQTPMVDGVYPGLAITITILAFNIFGDGLRDHLDPKLRGRLD